MGSIKQVVRVIMILLITLLLSSILITSANDDLTAWSNDDLRVWSNDDLLLMRTKDPQPGQPLVFAAKHRANYTRSECTVRLLSQDGEGMSTFLVSDDHVSDEDGNLVDWIEVWDDGEENTCGITILDRNNYHGDADDLQTGITFRLTFLEDGLFGQTRLNTLEAEMHVKDDLLTHIDENFIPTHYDLELIPDLLSLDPETRFRGQIDIYLASGNPTISGPMTVHADGFNIRKVNAMSVQADGSATEHIVDKIAFDLQKGKVSFYSEAILNSDWDHVNLIMDFEANIDPLEHTHAGLYKETCSDNSDKFCWFTQFESTSARYAFPCIDEPNKKATFDIKVARAEGWKTLSNMPVRESIPIPDWAGWTMDIFETTPVMPTYLIAFAIQDFARVEGVNNVTIWANKEEVDAGEAAYSQNIGPRIIEYYSSTFGIDYTLPKMDMVSVPKKGGAMENWGLILYSHDTLMYDQGSEDVEKKWRVLEVVAHELAHQWFGNLVTMDWWDQTWLNEGVASYISHLGAEAIDPDINSWERMVTHRMFKVMQDDSSDQSWAMSDGVKSRDDIHRKFGSITYSKGASIIRMMEGFLGYSTLVKGLSSYLEDFQYSNSVEEDLFLHLEDAALQDGSWPQYGFEKSFVETMKGWTNQAGYPIVTAYRTWVMDLDMLVFTQTWYTDTPNQNKQLWDIPINVFFVGVDSDEWGWDFTSPQYWLSEETFYLDLSCCQELVNAPMILNKKATGYYRVNYDTQNWLLIADTLMTNHQAIHPLNRAQIICDVIALSKTGHVTQEIHDAVMEYIDMESDFAPLNAIRECSQESSTINNEERI